MKTKRRPIVSIIITSDNDLEALTTCLDSFAKYRNTLNLRNIEFIIINNFKDDHSHSAIKFLVERYKILNKDNVTLFQMQERVKITQLKNLGMDFARGTWFFFMESTDIIQNKFLSFLAESKFDLRQDFYRVPIKTERNRKKRMGIFKTRYFSSNASSLLINREFLEKIELKWDQNISIGDTYILLNYMHSITNVNYIYLRKMYSIKHNFYLDRKSETLNNFEELSLTFDELLLNKMRNYKQYMIAIFLWFLSNNRNKKDFMRKNKIYIKKVFKLAKINYFSYLMLGPKLFIISTRLRWSTIF